MQPDQIICGEAWEELRKLPGESVDCCITSPPYYGLRNYQTGIWVGGDASHKHDRIAARSGRGGSGSPGKQTMGACPSDVPCDRCSCGARYVDLQIGLEASPEAYVAKQVEVFREVRRVLKDEGTLWLNLGDSYWGGKGQSNYGFQERRTSPTMERDHHNITGMGQTRPTDGKHHEIKPKDLIGIPWMVAFALRADGWWLRSDIIWEKPNCMPESVTDRPTRGHEYLFLFAKSQKYYYDAEAIKEPLSEKSFHPDGSLKAGHHARPDSAIPHGAKNPATYKRSALEMTNLNGRNKRTVWTIPTKPFKEAHFATFPEKLVEPCILAGTSEKGNCPACGKAWERVVDRKQIIRPRTNSTTESHVQNVSGRRGCPNDYGGTDVTTIGWRPSCSCILDCAWPAPTRPVVLDPFFGAGTVGVVAKKLGRSYIGIELSSDYVDIARRRIQALPRRLDEWSE